MELVTYPTTISTRKKKRVSQNIDTRRHFFPVKRPITSFCLQQKIYNDSSKHFKLISCC
jgi:hypothetical protein